MSAIEVPAAATGPDGTWDSAQQPTPGQWEQIARLACSLLDVDMPANRADAQIVVARLVLALNDPDAPARTVPEPEAF